MTNPKDIAFALGWLKRQAMARDGKMVLADEEPTADALRYIVGALELAAVGNSMPSIVAVTEARRALTALYLEAPETVVRDVSLRCEAAFLILSQEKRP